MIRPFLAAAALVLPTVLAACGAGTPARTATATLERADQRLTPAQATPGAALASATLAAVADVPQARARLGYVNLAAARALRAPLPTAELVSTVIGAGAPAADGAATAVRVGPVTVLDAAAPTRMVRGGSAALRRRLQPARPGRSVITPEAPSAVQSCLGDPAVQSIAGPALMGRKAAFGVGLVDTGEAPAGPKLLLCAAPHLVRDLARIERRLQARFGAPGRPAARRPLIGETDIGERDIVRAVVPLTDVEPSALRDLLAGGPLLRQLAGR